MGCFVSGSRSGKSVVYVSCKPCLKDLAAGLTRLMP
jgi:hypothetical protein